MIIDIMTWILMIFGLIMMIIAIFDYFKLIKSLKSNLQTQSNKHNKAKALLNIAVGALYFILGLFLVIKLIPAEYALIYFIMITLSEIIVKYIIKHKQ